MPPAEDCTRRDMVYDSAGVDAVIFDCDGVLVDIRESYNSAIDQTARTILEQFGALPDGGMEVDGKIIEAFKRAGGFNNEIDLAYAVVLCAYAAGRMCLPWRKLALDTADMADHTGIRSVRNALKAVQGVDSLVNRLDYPDSRRRGILYETFDQIFYGPDLYQEVYGKRSKFDGPGMIALDRVIPDRRLFETLRARFGTRVAMITGRGFVAAKHTLKDIMGWFDIGHSAFLEDLPRENAKPNPHCLLESVRGMGARHALYVGDSTEDVMMVRAANDALGEDPGSPCVWFCGITGASDDPQGKADALNRHAPDLMLDSVADLPKALNLE